MTRGEGVVRTEAAGSVGIIRIDTPPVNALSAAIRRGIMSALVDFAAAPEIMAIILTGQPQIFSAGADIKEFGAAKAAPRLGSVTDAIATCSKPVIAAIAGHALGGGLELALACRHRIAHADSKLGLPEVKLGLIPGAGGTVRLPALIGAVAALDMMISGDPVSAERALALGLLDQVVSGDPLPAALAFAVSRPESGRILSRHDDSGLEAAAAAQERKFKGQAARAAIVEAVRNAQLLPERLALDAEQRLFARLVEGVQSKALRHVFAAERDAARVAGIVPDGKALPVRQVGVVGAGTMGRGIAMSLANSGFAVTLVEADNVALQRGMSAISEYYHTAAAKRRMGMAKADACLAAIVPTLDFGELAACDFIIEAAFEDMAVKLDLFRTLDAVARPGALLATNTSYLDVDAIAAVTGRPQDVLGLHFFSPAHVMKLLEIVRGRETSANAVATVLALARQMEKVAVVVGVCHGFVGNRMLAARNAENEAMLLEGALPEQIDRAFREFGWPMGPFQMTDLAGLDIGWRNRRALGTKAPVADWLCDQGHFGQKTGTGFYNYEPNSRVALPNPELAAHLEKLSTNAGVERRHLDDREILERTLLPMVNEGRKIVQEGMARQTADIDLVWVHGYGFPQWKGGPMFWATHQNEFDIDTTLAGWFAQTGRKHFRPVQAS